MESMKTHLVVWLSGVVTGLILMERWRRLGDPSGPTAESVGGCHRPRLPLSPASADKPKGLKLIVAGATAEAERARQLFSQMALPWAKNSTASPSQHCAHFENYVNRIVREQRRLAAGLDNQVLPEVIGGVAGAG